MTRSEAPASGLLLLWRPLLVWLPLLLFATSATAQTHGGTGVLKIKPGLQQPGMGQAGVALDHGAQSMWWNPALLASARGFDADVTFAKLVPDLADDVYYFNLAGRMRLGSSKFVVGVDGAYLSYGESEVVDEEGESKGFSSSYEVAASLGVAWRPLGPRAWEPGPDLELISTIDLGLTVKRVRCRLAPDWAMRIMGTAHDGSASANATDLGVLLQGGKAVPGLGRAVWSFGGSMQNMWAPFGNKLEYVDADPGDPLPRNLKLGIGASLLSNARMNLLSTTVNLWRVALAADLNHSLIRYRERGHEIETEFGWGEVESIRNYGLAITAFDLATLQLGYIRDHEGEIKPGSILDIDAIGLKLNTIGGEWRFPLGVLSESLAGMWLCASVASIPQSRDFDRVLYWTAGFSAE